MNEFERCVRQRKLVRFDASPNMIVQELEAAEHDIESAGMSRERGDAKWASVQAYYSMFHCAKALVLSRGYREKSHRCLGIALREFYVKTKEIDGRTVGDFEMAMDLRHEADYGLAFSADGARLAFEMAQRMLETTRGLLS